MQVSNIAGKISIKMVTLKLQFKKCIPNKNYLVSLLSSQHGNVRQTKILQKSDLKKC
jgi:hypothetical protein